MLPYPPSTKSGVAENSLLRALGGVLALLSILLTVLGIILHQRVPDLILAVIVGIFALRVLILWLGDKPQQQQPFPMQSPPFTQGHSAQYVPLNSQPQPLYQNAPELYEQPTAPMPPTSVAPLPPNLPRSIRPLQPSNASAFPAQPASPPQVVQPIPLSQPTSLWPPTPYASVPTPSPAPVSKPSQEGHWQYDDGKNFTQQQRGNDNGTV